jgi:hypothetical protein
MQTIPSMPLQDPDDDLYGMNVGMTIIANKLPDLGATAATSISLGMAQIAHKLPDIGATASQSLERAATAVSGSMEKVATTVFGSMERAVKYMANVAMFVVVVLVVSRHFKH